jgi:hypothetical protein
MEVGRRVEADGGLTADSIGSTTPVKQTNRLIVPIYTISVWVMDADAGQ